MFRVGYADHSSWDMVWLRIDYNGHGGFDAFVTDASLARQRVSMTMEALPAPTQWTHLALALDETQGIRFVVNGVLAGRVDGATRLDAALDQFGPHSRALVDYNGAPSVKKWLVELADGLLAHGRRTADGGFTLRASIRFSDDEDVEAANTDRTWPLLWAMYRWTGNEKCLEPMLSAGPVRSAVSQPTRSTSSGSVRGGATGSLRPTPRRIQWDATSSGK